MGFLAQECLCLCRHGLIPCMCIVHSGVSSPPSVSEEDAATAFADREKMQLLDRSLEIRHVMSVLFVVSGCRVSVCLCLPACLFVCLSLSCR
jgi:hypothetical protein